MLNSRLGIDRSEESHKTLILSLLPVPSIGIIKPHNAYGFSASLHFVIYFYHLIIIKPHNAYGFSAAPIVTIPTNVEVNAEYYMDILETVEP